MAAVKAAGGGGVDGRDQLLGEGGAVVCAGWEEVQDIGGDGEADQRGIAVARSVIGRSGGSSPTGRSLAPRSQAAW